MPNFYLQYLSPVTEKPVLLFGAEVTDAVNRFGTGSAYLIGTLLGPAVLEPGSGDNQAFLGALLRKRGVAPDRAGKLIRRRRNLGDASAWFFFNPTHETIEERVSLAPFPKARDLLAGSLSVREGTATISVAPLDIKCLVLEVRTIVAEVFPCGG